MTIGCKAVKTERTDTLDNRGGVVKDSEVALWDNREPVHYSWTASAALGGRDSRSADLSMCTSTDCVAIPKDQPESATNTTLVSGRKELIQ